MSDQGILKAVGGRWQLDFERRLAGPRARVWALVTSREGLARWFPARVDYAELAVGAAMTFTFSDADIERAEAAGVQGVPLVSSGSIVELEEQRVFAFDWDGELVRFELDDDPNGCLLRFTHQFAPDRAQAPRNGAGWHVCLEALIATLSGGQAPGEARQHELQNWYLSTLELPE